ncbi:EAL domain-containing protein [Granulicella aggregans]|nr:EAL domain-containing protein [Granulicella aggregans]
MAAGFMLFRGVVLRLAMVELDHHAWRYMLRAEDSSKSSERFLKTMAAARLSACSDAEIAYMHHLLFQLEYLKDGGRMSGGRVECDSMFRASELPQKLFKPDFVLKDGTEVYTDIRLVPGDPEPRVGVQRGGFFVSFLHWRPDRLGNLPLNFTLTEVDEAGRPAGWLHGERPQIDPFLLAKDGWARAGDSLYATHCSPHYFNCFTAFVNTRAVLDARTKQSVFCTLLGGIAGCFVGLFCLLLYRRNRSMVHQLRRAIRDEKLHMVYQPIVQLRDRRIVEAEALVRWTDDDGFAVSPEIFVHVAEENGFVGELTELVVRLALNELGDLLREHLDLSLNINVTGMDLADPAFLPMLERSLAAFRVEAPSVTIEVTESSTARKATAVETIHILRARGHNVYIDDFGTGYSSLSYLHSLAVDAVKIDKSFTHSIGTMAVTSSILPQILAMAETLSLAVVAEGIETEEQADYFASYEQPILGQGWLFGRPAMAEDFCSLLEEHEVESSLLTPPGHGA